MKIALISDALYKWDGGIDFLTNIAVVLDTQLIDRQLELFLFIPKDSFITWLVKKIILGKKATDEKRKRLLIQNFKNSHVRCKIVFYRKLPRQRLIKDNGKRLDSYFKAYHIDIAFPVMIESYPKMTTPWISYIPDLQERHLPELFAQKEVRDRNNMYRRILRETSFVLVTSESVKKDIEKYYPDSNCKIYATPFAPVAPLKFFATENYDMEAYHLPETYFVVSNQFWAHKSHDTVFKALEILFKEGMKDVHVFCTGILDDYRGNHHIRKLRRLLDGLQCRNNIHILGYIPKLDQVELIKRSVAVIQPSELEGDCGGCSVYLARSLCVPSILSDIEVNIEGLGDKYLYFFKLKDECDLADKMKSLIFSERKSVSREAIKESNKYNTNILGKFYMDMIKEVISEFSNKKFDLKERGIK